MVLEPTNGSQSTHPPIIASLKHKPILILKLKEVISVIAGLIFST